METVLSLDSTIFAWSTPALGAARAVMRISGPVTFAVLGRIFTGDSAGAVRPGVTAGHLTLMDNLKVRCRLWAFAAPRSFTGQDMAEIHTVSSLPLRRLIDQVLLGQGLTAARAGEFSARAFLLGKMDLTQAQAIRELVEAENDAQIQAAMNLLDGRLHRWLTSVYTELADLATALEANLDFSEDEIQIVTLEQAAARMDALANTIRELLGRAIDSRAIAALPQVFLAGPANAGKSTLLNRLTGLDRAICSPLAGTTRDVLTAVWRHEGREVLLCDAPGLVTQSADALTRAAVARVAPFLTRADLVLRVIDAGRPVREQLQLADELPVDSHKTLTVLNKIDLPGDKGLAACAADLPGDGDVFAVSALTGQGLAALTHAVFARLGERAVTMADRQVVLDVQGREALEAALACLGQAGQDARALAQGRGLLGLETVALGVQEALRTVGKILGKDVTEDVLDNIFSRFCIGK